MKTIVLDTNVFIRFLIKDIAAQFEKAKEVFTSIEDGNVSATVSILVVNEIIWIMDNYYEIKRDIYIPQVLKLLALKHMKTMEIKKHMLVTILRILEHRNVDFTDVYLARVADGRSIVSFDKDIVRLQKMS